jgi:serine/threonine-protein kinase
LEPHGAHFAGRYRIVRQLGRGGFGAVYEAEHSVIGRTVALKVLHRHIAGNADARQRFLREARLAQELEHPVIVRALESGTTPDGTAYIAYELLEGQSLKERLKQGALGWRQTGDILLQLLEALAHAHGHGIVHRDLKPENVFLCPSTSDRRIRVKLLDFGIAKAVDEKTMAKLTATGEAIGTPRYMSPEQLRGEKLDGRSDLYALGILGAEMISGERFGAGKPGVDMLFAHLSPSPLELAAAAVRSSFGPALTHAVRKDRADRFTSASDMHAAITSVMTTSPALAPTADDIFVAARDLAARDSTQHGSGPPAKRAPNRRLRSAACVVLGLIITALLIAGIGAALTLS